jgi:hypothetical protein
VRRFSTRTPLIGSESCEPSGEFVQIDSLNHQQKSLPIRRSNRRTRLADAQLDLEQRQILHQCSQVMRFQISVEEIAETLIFWA